MSVGQDCTWISVLSHGFPAVLHEQDAGPWQQVPYVPAPQLRGPLVPVPQRQSEGVALHPYAKHWHAAPAWLG